MPLELPAFRPHPLVRGGHLQTIVGTYLSSRATLQPTLHHVPLPDGDALALHDDGRGADIPVCREMNGRQECLPHVAILLHGLAGSHQSAYMLRCSDRLRAAGLHVYRSEEHTSELQSLA